MKMNYIKESGWNSLSESDKAHYKVITKEWLGNTYVHCETGEPLYFDENGCMITFEQIYPAVRKIIRKLKLKQLQ